MLLRNHHHPRQEGSGEAIHLAASRGNVNVVKSLGRGSSRAEEFKPPVRMDQ